jgi:hypothetical protein
MGEAMWAKQAMKGGVSTLSRAIGAVAMADMVADTTKA